MKLLQFFYQFMDSEEISFVSDVFESIKGNPFSLGTFAAVFVLYMIGKYFPDEIEEDKIKEAEPSNTHYKEILQYIIDKNPESIISILESMSEKNEEEKTPDEESFIVNPYIFTVVDENE